jgi:hypothetical protein
MEARICGSPIRDRHLLHLHPFHLHRLPYPLSLHHLLILCRDLRHLAWRTHLGDRDVETNGASAGGGLPPPHEARHARFRAPASLGGATPARRRAEAWWRPRTLPCALARRTRRGAAEAATRAGGGAPSAQGKAAPKRRWQRLAAAGGGPPRWPRCWAGPVQREQTERARRNLPTPSQAGQRAR